MTRFLIFVYFQLLLLVSLNCAKLDKFESIDFDNVLANKYMSDGHVVFVAGKMVLRKTSKK